MNPIELKCIPGLELADDEPVFSEPWEAQAFALVVGLHQNGMFSWDEWANMLGETISRDNGKTPYYELWLDALESIVTEQALLSDTEVETRKADWQAALLATPHGQPIELERGSR